MSLVEQFNVGTRIRNRTGIANISVTQSCTVAPVATTGVTVDRNATGLRRYYSCKLAVAGTLTGVSSQVTATQVISCEHSSDGTSWDAFSTGTEPAAVTWGSTAGTTDTDTTGGETFNTVEQNVNLNSARRYVRIVLPVPTYADCSSGQFLALAGQIVFGGADELPAQ